MPESTTTAPPGGPAFEAPAMSKRQVWTVLVGLMLALLLAALDQTVVSTALFTIVKDLDPVHGLSQISWVVTVYLLAVTASMPLYGKISDLYGRKPVLIFALALFLAGSALCGLAAGMGTLILFRTIQGLGAGGMMSLVMAIIADMIPPRERGRYSGLGVAVMAVASVAGPFAGGFFTESHTLFTITTSWRWAFWINLPIGLFALIAVATVLRLPVHRKGHRIDFLGAALIVGAVCATLLVTVWGGNLYGWGSPQIVSLAVAAVLLFVAFFWWESKASEPIFPPRLFRLPVFRTASVLLFIIGFAMMGSIVYITLYLQLADGLSPTSAGLHLMPMTVGMAIASIVAGRLVSKYGKYKVFPIIGTALAAIAMGLMSLLAPDTSATTLSLYLVLLGLGLGQVMGIPQLAVQNSVEHGDMGAATSATSFTRAMGQSFGTAVFGAILTARLAVNMPAGIPGIGANGVPNVAQVRALPPALQTQVVDAFVRSADTVFQVTAAVLVVAFVMALLLKELPLRKRAGAK